MGFTAPKENYSGKVYSVHIGEGDREVTFGGENVLPFHVFEGNSPNRPLIAYEIQDVPPSDWPEILRNTWKDVSDDAVSWAKYCQDELNARAIAIRLNGTHPDREDRSPEDAAKTVNT